MRQGLIPLDKSWLMRMGLLDLLDSRTDMIRFLERQPDLGSDMQALLRASHQWFNGEVIEVGESGTLYRFMQFAAWQLGEERVFIKSGTLQSRIINNDPSIVSLSLVDLLKLDNGTSQWASAAVLCGSAELPPVPLPYKLGVTFEARDHWRSALVRDECWQAREDPTIARQAEAFLEWRKTGQMNFIPQQAEDYCMARAFDLINAVEGESRWPSLRQHESDRIESMERALSQNIVDSADHRVVQAVAMLKGQDVTYSNPECVDKSWPRFWELISG